MRIYLFYFVTFVSLIVFVSSEDLLFWSFDAGFPKFTFGKVGPSFNEKGKRGPQEKDRLVLPLYFYVSVAEM